ncbi:hypothetical protein BT69DRAFT_1213796 [Atractiella rhizophila]|nr:hypothetical protein BT69DRAFT_1213796 [Atractiella rhizophila]
MGDKELERQATLVTAPQKYKYNFWDREIKSQRTVYLKAALIGGLVILVLQVFTIMPFYWGSLYKEYSLIPNLRALVLDLDGSAIGTSISSALLSSNHGTHTHGTGVANLKAWLGWEPYTSGSMPPSGFGSDEEALEDARRQIEHEHAWVVVVIRTAATERLQTAFNGADALWNSSDVVQVFYSQARNELATGNFVVPYTTTILQRVNAHLAQSFGAQFLQAASGLDVVRSLPIALLTQPVGYTLNNLHPYDQPLATVLTFVGLIYVMVFAFQTTMMTSAFQVAVADYLNIRSLILLRVSISFIFYFFLSWAFAFLGLMFQGDFNRHFGGAGFFLYWLGLFLGMSSVGLALQALVTLLTVRFISILFVLILLTNVSVSLLPFDLLPSVYEYGKAWPAYNLSRLVRSILFGTKNDLSLNYGILLSWVAVSCVTLPLIQIWQRSKEVKAHEKLMAQSDPLSNGGLPSPAESIEKVRT